MKTITIAALTAALTFIACGSEDKDSPKKAQCGEYAPYKAPALSSYEGSYEEAYELAEAMEEKETFTAEERKLLKKLSVNVNDYFKFRRHSKKEGLRFSDLLNDTSEGYSFDNVSFENILHSYEDESYWTIGCIEDTTPRRAAPTE